MSGFVTAACCSCGSIRARRRRWCLMLTTELRPVQGRLRARHLRQYEDGGGDDLRRQAAPLQSPLPADVQPLPRRSGRLHAGVGLGEGPVLWSTEKMLSTSVETLSKSSSSAK